MTEVSNYPNSILNAVNRLAFKLSSDSIIEVAGVKASNRITFVSVAAKDVFIVTFNSDYNKVYSYNIVDVSEYAIDVVAKSYGLAYNFEYTDTTEYVVSHVVEGVDMIVKSDYKVIIQAVLDGNYLGSFAKEFTIIDNDNNLCKVDLSNILDSHFFTNAPNINFNGETTHSNIVKKLSFRYGDIYRFHTVLTTPTMTEIADIDIIGCKLNQGDNGSHLNTILTPSAITNKVNFITNWDSGNNFKLYKNNYAWLYFYLPTNVMNYTYHSTINKIDGTTETLTDLQPLGEVNAGKVVSIGAGAVNADFLLDADVVKSYSIYVEIATSAGTYFTETFTYEIISGCGKQLFFQNALGGIDTFIFTEFEEIKSKVKPATYEVFASDSDDTSSYGVTVYDNELEQEYTYRNKLNSFFHNQLDWINDFYRSKDKYAIVDGKLYKAIPKTTSFKLKQYQKQSSNTFSFTLNHIN